VSPLGAQKDGRQRMLNQDCREDEDLIHLPVWLNAVYWEQIGQMKA